MEFVLAARAESEFLLEFWFGCMLGWSFVGVVWVFFGVVLELFWSFLWFELARGRRYVPLGNAPR